MDQNEDLELTAADGIIDEQALKMPTKSKAVTTSVYSKPYILVIQENAHLVTLLRHQLEKQGFRVEATGDGCEALARAVETPSDLLLMDWTLPGIGGIDLCRRLRRHTVTRLIPIIMLSDNAEDLNVGRSLDAGADYLVPKPFSTVVLIARIRALLRRSQAVSPMTKLGFQDISLYPSAHRAYRNGQPLRLGPIEFHLLEFFLSHPQRVFSREDVLNEVWGHASNIQPRTVDVHIRRLRSAIKRSDEVGIIRTIRTEGYTIDPVGF